jgi:hypothetical protein
LNVSEALRPSCELPSLEVMISMDVISNLLYLSDIATNAEDRLKYATMARNQLKRVDRMLYS